MTRIKVLNAPAALPGHCAICRAARSDDRKYVDFNFQVENYGAVIFCTLCLNAIAEAIHYVPGVKLSEALEEYTENLNTLTNRIKQLDKKNKALEEVLGAEFDFGVIAERIARDLSFGVWSHVEGFLKAEQAESKAASSKSGARKASGS